MLVLVEIDFQSLIIMIERGKEECEENYKYFRRERGGLDRHEMAIFQCEDRKGKFILFFSDENSTAELISVHRISELIRSLIFYAA